MGSTVQQTQKNQVERVTAWSVFSDLVKLRLTTLVLVTTLVGFYAGLNSESGGLAQNLIKLGLTLLGTGLLAAGAAILNQYLERDHDARMERTARRPLPSGAISAEAALLLGGACSVVGLLALAAWVNLLVAVLGAVTLVTYLFIYTPLKRKSEWNTIIGAIPGALPPLMGWAAARGEVDPLGWTMFGILFFWQVPHFMAIAWMYRDDYRLGGFRMLSRDDQHGSRTAFHMLVNGVLLLISSLTFYFVDQGGFFFLMVSIMSGIGFLASIVGFMKERSVERARMVFLVSIVYLPVLCTVMVIDRIFII